KLIIKIKDTGIGIPRDKLQAIMQPFYQVNQSSSRKFGGAGLGLTIVSRMLEKLDGTINIESALNKGTTILFTFPVKLHEDSVRPVSPAVFSEEKNLTGLTILAVEDDPISIKYLDKILRDAGVEFKIADSYSEMLKICAEGLIPDVALLDIALPDSDGFECIKWLKQNIQGKQTRFIAQTAHVFSVDQARYTNAGFDSFIGKPYSKDELIEVIAKVT
ncbi:MAG: response regulator, partial [Victivallaceae bacterium]